MALHMRQDLRISQQLVMTPQLQQAIKLLQLSRVELTDLVRDELMENPLLEESQEMGTTVEEPVSSIELQDAVDQPNETVPEREAAAPETTPEVKSDSVPKDSSDYDAYADNTLVPDGQRGGERRRGGALARGDADARRDAAGLPDVAGPAVELQRVGRGDRRVPDALPVAGGLPAATPRRRRSPASSATRR
jgi:hypothetical protein